MSSNKKEGKPSKRRFPFFKRKTSVPLGNSNTSIDNHIKIEAMANIADAINAAIRSNSKKGRKDKSKSGGKGKAKAVADPQDFDPAKPKNLAKLFKKYGDREITEPLKDNFPPKLSSTFSENGANCTAEASKPSVSDQGDTASDNDALEKAALKIQTAWRGRKFRRQYLSSRRNVIKVQALVRGVIARKHVAELKIAANKGERATEEGSEN